ncbi:MAG: hypothetical protein ACRD0G_11375 [Acidimicrobiales bacterium]
MPSEIDAGYVVRPIARGANRPSAPFYRNVSLSSDGTSLVVTDEDGATHRFPIGERPGSVAALAFVIDLSSWGGTAGVPGTERMGRSWLMALDTDRVALVASPLDEWDGDEVHAWWYGLHGLPLPVWTPGSDQAPDEVPTIRAGTTLLVEPTKRTGTGVLAALWVAAVLFALVPVVVDIPIWTGVIPLAGMLIWLVAAGAVRRQRARQEQARRRAALERLLPPDQRGEGHA